MVKNNYFAPWDFKYTVSEYEELYKGNEQHDSYEFLNKVLDFLHEDLNRVKNRTKIILEDSQGKPEKVVALEQWKLHTRQNDSIIVDLFYGQIRTKTKWKVWNHVSLKFDPFSSLSLPFPFENEDLIEFSMIYHPYNYEKEGAVTTYKVKWSPKLTLKGLTDELKNIMGEDIDPEYFVKDDKEMS